MNKNLGLAVSPRPWYEWLLWLGWLLVEVFLLQNAVTSAKYELQSTAATIFWVMFAVILLAGVVVWYVRRPK